MEQPIFDVCMPQNSISLEKMHIKLPMELGSKCFHQVMFIVYLLKVVNHWYTNSKSGLPNVWQCIHNVCQCLDAVGVFL